jgi:hypothetical protein
MDRRPAKGFFRDDYFYAANCFATAEHGRTHIDAPIHFFADRETVDQIPLAAYWAGRLGRRFRPLDLRANDESMVRLGIRTTQRSLTNINLHVVAFRV